MNSFNPENITEDPFEEGFEETPAPSQNLQLPAAIDAEKALIGGLLLNGQEHFPSILSIVTKGDFFNYQHQHIYAALSNLFDNNVDFDPIAVCNLLLRKKHLDKAGGQNYIMELATHAVFNSNLESLANIIFERAVLRNIIEASKQSIADSYSGEAYSSQSILEKADQRLREIADSKPVTGGFKSMEDILESTFDRLQEIRDRGTDITGITTGFTKLNKITSGWQRSDLIVLAARPSMGKTALALSFLEHAARDKQTVLLFSLEMPAVAITMRLLAAMSKIPLSKIREANLFPSEWNDIAKAVAALKDYNISIDDSSSMTILQMRDRIRRYARTHEMPNLIIVDYLGLMQSPAHADNRVQEISQISGGLKQIARDFECPVIALSQLSRNVEQRNSKKPVLADLRDSGSIEQDADLIMFIYRDEYYNKENSKRKGIADIIIGKHRNGEIGEIPLAFLPELAQFSNIAFTKPEETQ